VGIILLFEFTPLDIIIQDSFYNFNTHHWIINRNEPISKFIFYYGIKRLFIALFLSLVVSIVFFRKSHWVQQHKHGLQVVILSALLIPLLIGALKATTNIPCPKNLSHYGGVYPYVRLLEKYPASFHPTTKIKCYPAGHASGAFALLSLVFLFKTKKSKTIAVSVIMIIGWSMGNYKMLIGDHFLSHTLVTMLIAWWTIIAIHKGLLKFKNTD